MSSVRDFGPAGLEFAILGPLQVVRDGQSVPLGGARQRAVLARLLVEPGRTVSLAGFELPQPRHALDAQFTHQTSDLVRPML